MIKSILKTLVIFLIFLSGTAFGQSGDLEVIAIDPAAPTIPQNTSTNLVIAVQNNGPQDLPAGSARITLSIDPTLINWILPITVTDDCGNVWALQTVNPTATTSTIQIRNNNAALVNGAGCFISIPVTGIAQGNANITVGSTVFGGGASDPNGTNQGASTALTVTAPMPVTLTSFTVSKEGQAAQLNWSTTEETNSDRFEIERSLNGKKWGRIGTVASNGESKVLRNYNFSDASPQQGENLYRLKMVDKDETFAYSRIQSVSFESLPFFVYPNPVVDFLSLNGGADKYSNISIIDMSGKIVYTYTPVSTSVKINVKGLVDGAYLVKATGLDGTIHTHKVVLAH